MTHALRLFAITLFLAAALLLGFTGCSDDDCDDCPTPTIPEMKKPSKPPQPPRPTQPHHDRED